MRRNLSKAMLRPYVLEDEVRTIKSLEISVVWLYRGGAGTHRRKVAACIASGNLGRPLPEKAALVQRFMQ